MSGDRKINVNGVTYYREPDQTMTLGKLIEALEYHDPHKGCRFDFGRQRPCVLGSWRGDYSQLTITSSDQEGTITVGEVLKMLEEADGETYTGWKGGEFKMNLKTRIWADNDGECSQTGIVGLDSNTSAVIILTAYIDT